MCHLDLPDEFFGLVVMLILLECAFDVGHDLADESHDVGRFLARLINLALELLLCLIQQLQQLQVLSLQPTHSVSVRLGRLRGTEEVVFIVMMGRHVLGVLLLVQGRVGISCAEIYYRCYGLDLDVTSTFS